MDGINSISAWALILGFLTPHLVAVVNQPRWTKGTRQVVAVVIAILVGVVNLIVQGALANIQITLGGILVALATVLGASQAAYAVLWQPTGIAPRVEKATSKDLDLAA